MSNSNTGKNNTQVKRLLNTIIKGAFYYDFFQTIIQNFRQF